MEWRGYPRTLILRWFLALGIVRFLILYHSIYTWDGLKCFAAAIGSEHIFRWTYRPSNWGTGHGRKFRNDSKSNHIDPHFTLGTQPFWLDQPVRLLTGSQHCHQTGPHLECCRGQGLGKRLSVTSQTVDPSTTSENVARKPRNLMRCTNSCIDM
jgi:hypothetical protein